MAQMLCSCVNSDPCVYPWILATLIAMDLSGNYRRLPGRDHSKGSKPPLTNSKQTRNSKSKSGVSKGTSVYFPLLEKWIIKRHTHSKRHHAKMDDRTVMGCCCCCKSVPKL